MGSNSASQVVGQPGNNAWIHANDSSTGEQFLQVRKKTLTLSILKFQTAGCELQWCLYKSLY